MISIEVQQFLRDVSVMAVVLTLVVAILVFVYRKSFVRKVIMAIGGGVFLAYTAGVARATFPAYVIAINQVVLLSYTVVVVRMLLRSLKQPIDSIAHRIGLMATGNFAAEGNGLSVTSNDEFSVLSRQFALMVEQIANLVRRPMEASLSMAAESEQFKQHAGTIAQGANQQAASTEEISSAVEELVANISQNLDNAKQGALIGNRVDSDLKHVSTAFGETEVGMRDIQERIAAIHDIANKTNILAINAAIEAARAGEMGRGFAVVAGEVRRLADQSSKLSDEIQQRTTHSADAVDTMGNTLREAIPSIQQMVDVVKEIAAASGEQKAGTEQIGTALATLSQVTNAYATTSNALNESAERLVTLSDGLRDSMQQFKTQ